MLRKTAGMATSRLAVEPKHSSTTASNQILISNVHLIGRCSVGVVSTRSAATRERLIEAAGEVFAAEGYRKATIDQICRRAGANIAAVNYHFGDKEKLYAEVFAYADRCATEAHPVAVTSNGSKAEERLRRQIEALIGRLFDRGRPAWHAQLMAREMVEPTAVLDRRVDERIRATYDQLAAIVRELIGAKAAPETVRLCVFSILGQCVFYRHSAPIITRLHPRFDAASEAPGLAAHVTRFSLEAIRGLRSSAQKGRR